MNNEPVAWMSEFGQFIGKVQDEICHIPLYTHPVKEQKYEWEYVGSSNEEGLIEIVMPIQKWKELIEYVDGKAQEK